MINEQIRCKEVRVIGEEGQQLGVMTSKEAMNLAKEAGVDLVMVSPSANPPVCRIVDYGKFKYEQLRREKEAKKKQKVVEVKEVRLSPNIDVNDLNTKCNAARKFIEKGNKVKVSLRFRGREMAHVDTTKHILEDFAEKLSDVAVIEKAPKMEGSRQPAAPVRLKCRNRQVSRPRLICWDVLSMRRLPVLTNILMMLTSPRSHRYALFMERVPEL